MKKISLVLLTLGITAIGSPLSAQNVLVNGDFEKGTSSWSIFAPQEAKDAEAALNVVEGGLNGSRAGQMSCSTPTRFAIANYLKAGSFSPNQRMRVSAWIKAGEGFEAVPNTPGFAIRVTMFADGEGAEGGMIPAQDSSFYVGLNGVAVRGQNTSPLNNQDIPSEWTKVEGVFETSPDATKMNIAIFIWKGSGALLVDDVAIEPVDQTVPLSPLTN